MVSLATVGWFEPAAKGIFNDLVNDSGSPLTTTIPYLEKLNPQQRFLK
jgi:hypothetical protein